MHAQLYLPASLLVYRPAQNFPYESLRGVGFAPAYITRTSPELYQLSIPHPNTPAKRKRERVRGKGGRVAFSCLKIPFLRYFMTMRRWHMQCALLDNPCAKHCMFQSEMSFRSDESKVWFFMVGPWSDRPCNHGDVSYQFCRRMFQLRKSRRRLPVAPNSRFYVAERFPFIFTATKARLKKLSETCSRQ